MNKVSLISTVLGALMFSSLPGLALADKGGEPNANAEGFGSPGSDTANGRKGNCLVMGDRVSDFFAPMPGSVPEATAPFGFSSPGDFVSEFCGANPS